MLLAVLESQALLRHITFALQIYKYNTVDIILLVLLQLPVKTPVGFFTVLAFFMVLIHLQGVELTLRFLRTGLVNSEAEKYLLEDLRHEPEGIV